MPTVTFMGALKNIWDSIVGGLKWGKDTLVRMWGVSYTLPVVIVFFVIPFYLFGMFVGGHGCHHESCEGKVIAETIPPAASVATQQEVSFKKQKKEKPVVVVAAAPSPETYKAIEKQENTPAKPEEPKRRRDEPKPLKLAMSAVYFANFDTVNSISDIKKMKLVDGEEVEESVKSCLPYKVIGIEYSGRSIRLKAMGGEVVTFPASQGPKVWMLRDGKLTITGDLTVLEEILRVEYPDGWKKP